MPRWPEKAEGKQKSKRARRRKLETAKAELESHCWQYSGGQGVHQVEDHKMESEGHEEKYRAVIDGETQDEPVGQRWDRSSLHYGGEGALIHPPTPRCLRTARYGRTARDLRRTGQVSGWHRGKQTYKRKRSGERGSVSSRTAEYCAPSSTLLRKVKVLLVLE
jgi:hypothetical protein